jgi:hypothetical protein
VCRTGSALRPVRSLRRGSRLGGDILLWYLAAKAGIHIIDVSRIDDNIAKVMRQCAAAPNLTVPLAFREALRLPAHG